MIVWVTGANRGIGHEVSWRLLGLGWTVRVVTARSERAAQDAAARLGSGVHPLRLDVTSPDDSAEAARSLRERFGGLDVLVNNAAITYDTWQRAVGADLDVVREAMEINVERPPTRSPRPR
ncbi:SDR family NAD(P)-dependent oxidoreductase [Streptomyces sp. SS7]|uniref:SDR family oxidoreductase n=1 Tax=Streptomyces sp. SS7 TaxID=3108485 RepID=UPI0030EC7FBA